MKTWADAARGGLTPAYDEPAPTSYGDDIEGRHYNYEDKKSQSVPRHSGGQRLLLGPYLISTKSQKRGAQSRFDRQHHPILWNGKASGRPGSFARPAMDLPTTSGAAGLKQGQRVRHAKYGEGTVLMREGDGEGAKVTVMFARHGMKKLMEKFANLEKL